MNITTERLTIKDLSLDMAGDIQRNSLDEDNRKFVPDEVFESLEEAEGAVNWLIDSYNNPEGPYLYAIFTNENKNIGYVQLCSVEEGWEIGYHIAKSYTKKGYAAEAVSAFLTVIMCRLKINEVYGIVLEENIASYKVLEKSGFRLQYKGVGRYQGEARKLRKYIYKTA